MPARTKVNNRVYSKYVIERTALVLILAVLLVFYVFLPQLKYFRGSISTIQDVYLPMVGWAILLVAATYLLAAATLRLLANFRLDYWQTVLIQTADGFMNRLLPAGAGGIATNVVYLSRRHGRVQAGMIVGLNNLMGFIGHVLLLLSLLLINSLSGGKMIAVKFPMANIAAAAAAGLLALIAIVYRRRLIHAAPKSSRTFFKLLKYIINHPGRLVAALVSSMSLTACYALALFMTMLALNVHLSFLQAFLVLTLGVLAVAVTPTPGGIGGAEAGIVAAQIGFGVPGEQALSVALVYRLVSYWLPLLPGLIALRVALGRHYLKV